MPPVKRKKYFHTNTYQRQIIGFTIIPCVLLCLLITLLLKTFHQQLTNMILFGTMLEIIDFINKWAVFIIVVAWSFFLFLIISSYVISTNLVGPFTRIMAELDQTIKDGKKKPISARPKDKLANELLKRINKLIDK